MNSNNILSLFQLYDISIAGESELLDYDSQLHELGSFSNLFLPNIVSLIKKYHEEPDQFTDACKTCRGNLQSLLSFLTNQQIFHNSTQHCIDLIDHIEENKEEKIAELTEIAGSYFKLFEMKMRRAQADLTLTMNKQNKTQDVIKAQDQINKYINKTFDQMKVNSGENQTCDPLLVTVESCEKFKSYLTTHKIHFPRCFCREKADVFAVPCNCPCFCKQCWEFEENTQSMKTCPRCAQPIAGLTELI